MAAAARPDELARVGWKEPDDGIWEVRGGRQHFTHSKVLAWVAADRAARTLETWPELDGPVERYRALRDEIHARRVREGLRPGPAARSPSPTAHGARRGAAAHPAGRLPAGARRAGPRHAARGAAASSSVDGMRAPLRHRTRPTTASGATRARSSPAASGSPTRSCWTARSTPAAEQFERLLTCATTSACSPRSTTSRAGRQLGNYPQAYSHLALVYSALNLTHMHGPGAPVEQRATGDD